MSTLHVLKRLIKKSLLIFGGTNRIQTIEDRVRMTLSCRDTDRIPKVPGAGSLSNKNGILVQRMHEGSLVRADGYYGEWMSRIISGLKGHHEPQEELIFHHLIQVARPNSLIVEIGAFWAYYTNWYLGAVAGSDAVCVEPDKLYLKCGEENLSLNGRQARWINACVGGAWSKSVTFKRDSDKKRDHIPCHNMVSLAEFTGNRRIEVLHMDVQGAELSFLGSMDKAVAAGLVRFVLVSTHHASISHSPTTHQDCLSELKRLGATILCEHNIDESFSGDGFIAASFQPEDSHLILTQISRNTTGASIFRRFLSIEQKLSVVNTHNGPMLVDTRDQVISRSLRVNGHSDEPKIAEVVRFLTRQYQFCPRTFVDIGANIGTHLIYALTNIGFDQGIGFEMDRDNFALLKCNLILNRIDERARVFHLALSDQEGEACEELSRDNFGDHRIRSRSPAGIPLNEENTRITKSIKTSTVNLFFPTHHLSVNHETLVWIDTQGHEGQILEGASKVFFAKEACPFVVIEFWPYGVNRSQGKEPLFRFLRRARAIYDIGRPDWVNLPPITLPMLELDYQKRLAETTTQHHSFTDLLCIL